jgi:Leucine-rich repeat (LRR) protein
MEGIKITNSPFLANLSHNLLKNCVQIKILNLSYNNISSIEGISNLLNKSK